MYKGKRRNEREVIRKEYDKWREKENKNKRKVRRRNKDNKGNRENKITRGKRQNKNQEKNSKIKRIAKVTQEAKKTKENNIKGKKDERERTEKKKRKEEKIKNEKKKILSELQPRPIALSQLSLQEPRTHPKGPPRNGRLPYQISAGAFDKHLRPLRQDSAQPHT